MSPIVYSPALFESLDLCLERLQEKREEAQIELEIRIQASGIEGDGIADDAEVPEKLDDPIADGLCRLDSVSIDDAVDYVGKFLMAYRGACEGLEEEEAQRLLIDMLRVELRDHMVYGTPQSNFDLLLNAMEELEDTFDAALTSRHPHVGSQIRARFFDPVNAYCDLAEGTMLAIERMLYDNQKKMGWPEDTCDNDLFRIAQRQLINEGRLADPANDALMSENEIDLCGARAKEIFEKLLEPYKDVLPMQYAPELPWFIQQLTNGFQHKAATKSSIDVKDPANDNEDDVTHARVLHSLSKLFLKHLNTAEDPYDLLAAAEEVTALVAPKVSARGAG